MLSKANKEILDLCLLDVREFLHHRNRHSNTPELRSKRKAILNAYSVLVSQPEYKYHRALKTYQHVLEYAALHKLPEPKPPKRNNFVVTRKLTSEEIDSPIFDHDTLGEWQQNTLFLALTDARELGSPTNDEDAVFRRSVKHAYKRMLTDERLRCFLLRPEYSHIPITDYKVASEIHEMVIPERREKTLKELVTEKEKEIERKRQRKLYMREWRRNNPGYRYMRKY